MSIPSADPDSVMEQPASPTVASIAPPAMTESTSDVPQLPQEEQEPDNAIPAVVPSTLEPAPPLTTTPQDPISISTQAPCPGPNFDLGHDLKLSSQPASLLTSPTIDSPLSQDPIEAIDALEDAIEEIGKMLPKLEPISPEKPARKATPARSPPTAAKRASRVLTSKTHPSLTAATEPAKPNLSRTRSTNQKPTSSLLKTTQTSALSRSTSVRATPPSKPTVPPNTAAKRKPTVSPQKTDDGPKQTSKPVDYLALKRRPISMQFPPPPQPIKSSKPPTKPTFSLPGDAITSRKKAQLEEKQKREQEELAKKREFKARPAPNQAKPRPASMIVRQTTSSRARLSIIGDVSGLGGIGDQDSSTVSGGAGLKRSKTVTSATSRSSAMVGKSDKVSPANIAQKRTSTAINSKVATTDAFKRSSIIVPKRQSTMLSTTQPTAAARSVSVSRTKNTSATPSVVSRATTKSTVSNEDAVLLKQKAREIYNRDRVDKENRERERREKEDAAKRARAEAAEKGRQASREWAEKQKRRLLETQALRRQQQEAKLG
jgi:hypothetical protein